MWKQFRNFWQEQRSKFRNFLQELKYRLTPMSPSYRGDKMSESWVIRKELYNGEYD